ncbi:MAG: histidine kinase [Bacteroidetes bacterium]|nr:histidine kinase [Bacteroidota bacterium]
MKRTREILLHLGAWLLYAGNSVLTYPSEYLEKYGFAAIGFKQGTYYVVMSVAFYANYLLLVPRLLARRRHAWYAGSVALLLPFMLGLFLLHAVFLDWYFDAGTFFLDDRIAALPYLAFQVLFFLLISTGARFTADWFHLQRLREEMQHEKEQAELALLRQQLSPHFLFNTLNNIYSLAVHNPKDVPRAILMLADLMRAILRNMNGEQILLEQEIAQLRSFIELKRLQYPDPERIRFTVSGESDGQRIAPMLLLPFVENAFKHGDLRSPGAVVDMRLAIGDAALQFSIENRISNGSKDATSGIGLTNVRRRLELLYPDRHVLDIHEENRRYRASLMLRFS